MIQKTYSTFFPVLTTDDCYNLGIMMFSCGLTVFVLSTVEPWRLWLIAERWAQCSWLCCQTVVIKQWPSLDHSTGSCLCYMTNKHSHSSSRDDQEVLVLYIFNVFPFFISLVVHLLPVVWPEPRWPAGTWDRTYI